MDWMSGFNFSAGLVDFVLGWPLATKPYMLIVQGLVFAVIYYFVFDFAIRKFNLMTPGREAEEVAAVDEAPAAGEDKYITMASRIYAALGGASNVKSIENCTTRLRLVVNDTSLVDRSIRVVTPEPDKLRAIFTSSPEVTVVPDTRKSDDPQVGEVFRVNGADLVAAAQAFARAGLITYEFVEEHASLEESYMALTHSSAEYLAKKVG